MNNIYIIHNTKAQIGAGSSSILFSHNFLTNFNLTVYGVTSKMKVALRMQGYFQALEDSNTLRSLALFHRPKRKNPELNSGLFRTLEDSKPGSVSNSHLSNSDKNQSYPFRFFSHLVGIALNLRTKQGRCLRPGFTPETVLVGGCSRGDCPFHSHSFI